MANVDLYSAIITKVSNALDTLVSGEKPGFQTLSTGLVVLLCAEVVRQRVPDHGAGPDLREGKLGSCPGPPQLGGLHNNSKKLLGLPKET